MNKLLLLLVFLCCPSISFSQWAITSVKAKPVDAKTREAIKAKAAAHGAKTTAVAEDFILETTLRNESSDILYVRGIRFGEASFFYIVESFIKNAKGGVWERENILVDQKVDMLPVKPGAEFKTQRWLSTELIGRSMMLTFRTSHSNYDKDGEGILVGPFEIPSPPKEAEEAAAKETEPIPPKTNTK